MDSEMQVLLRRSRRAESSGDARGDSTRTLTAWTSHALRGAEASTSMTIGVREGSYVILDLLGPKQARSAPAWAEAA